MNATTEPGATEEAAAPATTALWDGDTGTLHEQSRRAVVQLLRGPYLAARRHPQLWNAVLGDEHAIRSSLANLFLDLVVDAEAEVAFVRNAAQETFDAPKVVRSAPLTFMDTALLLHLRQQLLQASGGERVIVGVDELADQLQVYRGRDNADPAMFGKRINASWTKLEKYGILARTSTEGRFEISPVLRLIFGAEEIAAVQAEFDRIAERATGVDLPEQPAHDEETG